MKYSNNKSSACSHRWVLGVLGVMGCVGLAPAYAEVSGEIQVGVEHDSQLSVVELDRSRDESDQALTLDLELDYKSALSQSVEFSAGYNLSQSLHRDFDEFDVRTHLLSAGLAYDVNQQTSLGLNYYYADSSLDNESFLDLHRLSPSISHYFSKQLLTRAQYSYSDKSFDDEDARDADVNDIGIDVFYFLNRTRHYVSLGYRFREEDSQTDTFDYDSHQIKLRWLKRLSLFESVAKKGVRLKAGLTYESRRYDDDDSANGRRREDDRLKVSADIELRLDQRRQVIVDYEYSDFDSNLEAVDYTQHLIGLRYRYQFF